jgi:hypothetical protein
MARRRKPAPAAPSQTVALFGQIATMHLDAGMTIALRMPLLLDGAMGGSRGLQEASTAVTEKLSAISESGFAAGQAAAQLWWSFALAPLAAFDPHAAAVTVASRAVEPFARRTRANAARLARRD